MVSWGATSPSFVESVAMGMAGGRGVRWCWWPRRVLSSSVCACGGCGGSWVWGECVGRSADGLTGARTQAQSQQLQQLDPSTTPPPARSIDRASRERRRRLRGRHASINLSCAPGRLSGYLGPSLYFFPGDRFDARTWRGLCLTRLFLALLHERTHAHAPDHAIDPPLTHTTQSTDARQGRARQQLHDDAPLSIVSSSGCGGKRS